MKILFYLLVFLSLIFICAKLAYDPKHHHRTFYRTLNKASSVIEKKYKLVPIGSGGQAFEGPITLLSLSFQVYGPLTKEQLRSLLISCSKDFLSVVNTNKEIEFYLAAKPFTIEHIDILIFNYDRNRRAIFDPEITVARLSEGKLHFRTVDPASPGYKNSYKESYEDALKLIQTSKPPENEKPN